MKKLIILSLCVAGMIVASTTDAQEISWEIKLHTSDDINQFEREVTNYVNRGYVPLGVTYDDVELYILYVKDLDLEMQAWSLEWYDNRDDVQNGVTENMNDDYLPVGITYTGELFYVLYIQTDSSATAWKLEPAARNLRSVQNAIQPYVNQGYVPVGVTAFEGEYWTLLLKIPETTVEYWMLETYAVGTHADHINAAIEQDYIPWGLMYDAENEEIDILYAGF